MDKVDYKKSEKKLYFPKKSPSVIEIPEMVFIMTDGRGNPNTSESYAQAMEILYGLSYTIKMSKMKGNQPAGYFEYVVPPLEGLWSVEGAEFDGLNITDKDKFCWTSMIRQPEFVTEEVFEWARGELQKKKPWNWTFPTPGWNGTGKDYAVRSCILAPMMMSLQRSQRWKNISGIMDILPTLRI